MFIEVEHYGSKNTKTGQITPSNEPSDPLCTCYTNLKTAEMVLGYLYRASEVNQIEQTSMRVIILRNIMQKYNFNLIMAKLLLERPRLTPAVCYMNLETIHMVLKLLYPMSDIHN